MVRKYVHENQNSSLDTLPVVGRIYQTYVTRGWERFRQMRGLVDDAGRNLHLVVPQQKRNGYVPNFEESPPNLGESIAALSEVNPFAGVAV